MEINKMEINKMEINKMSSESIGNLKQLLQNYDCNITKSKGRKIRESDLNMTSNIYETNHTKDLIKSFRMQTEYGPKKFIKP